MADKRYNAVLAYLVIISILLIISQSEKGISDTDKFNIENRKIAHLYINNKELGEEFYPYLKSLNASRLTSIGKEYFKEFKLKAETADIVRVQYLNGKELLIYTGITGNQLSGLYIRLEDSDRIWEVGGDFFKIWQQKPDPEKEIRITENLLKLNSIIAVKLEDTDNLMYLTENSDNSWLDQFTGIQINRLKVLNLINKILNLRAVPFMDISDLIGKQLLKIHIETNDGRTENLIFRDYDNEMIHIENSAQSEFIIPNEKFKMILQSIENLE